MHEVFAAVRIWQLEKVQKLPKHAAHAAERLIGLEKWRDCLSKLRDPQDNLIETAFNILHATGYEDEPGDNIRTLANMELATIRYINQRWEHLDNWPIYVADTRDPLCVVGIEQPFDVTLQYEDGYEARYIGTIDGLVLEKQNKNLPRIDENKTASRLDDAWEKSFDMSHQITGYCACSTTVFGFRVLNSRVIGMRFRPTATEDISLIYPLQRDAYSILHWGAWVRHGAEMFDRHRDNWENAPRFTHSCSRYFRPCSLIHFCADTPDGRQQQWEHDMVEAPLSPSERAVLEM